MTQEEKALILKELCARLPYGIYVEMYSFSEKRSVKLESIDISDDDYLIINETWWLRDEYPKPVLRPMSSMTEEEYEKYKNYELQIKQAGIRFNTVIIEYLTWINSHHFDFNRLIEKGLALEAPKDMYS